MLKQAITGVLLSTVCFAFTPLAAQQTQPATTQAPALQTSASQIAPIDAVRFKLAQQIVIKLIPDGTYEKLLKEMSDKMASSITEQMLGMKSEVVTGIAGTEENDPLAMAVKGKTLGEIAAEKDPQFKERMDITMKVMFTEMGTLMSDMEPIVRTAMAKIYVRQYTQKQMMDMLAFFNTPSGGVFANNFMASFTDKEMMDATLSMTPKMMTAMPEIMKKIKTATAHLPPLAKANVDTAQNIAAQTSFDTETTDEPWYSEETWTTAQRKKVAALKAKFQATSEKQTLAYGSYLIEQNKAVATARNKLKANYDEMLKDEPPVAAEVIPAGAPPPPALPKT